MSCVIPCHNSYWLPKYASVSPMNLWDCTITVHSCMMTTYISGLLELLSVLCHAIHPQSSLLNIVISAIIHSFLHYEILFCIHLFMPDFLQCLHDLHNPAMRLCGLLLPCCLSVIMLFISKPCAWLNPSLLFSPASWVLCYLHCMVSFICKLLSEILILKY